jgi:hypothetical protein
LPSPGAGNAHTGAATYLVFYVLEQEALWGELDGYMYFGIKVNRMSGHPPSQAEKLLMG